MAGIAVAVLLVGGVVAWGQTPWWSCHAATRTGADPLGYELAPSPESVDIGALAEQIQSVPGVGHLLGTASLEQDVHLAEGAGGDLLVSESPYFSERNAFHDVSVNPVTGESTWSRGQAGQSAAPDVEGDSVLTFAAVEGGLYRLTILDAADGSVKGCIDVERLDDNGIGVAATAVSPDGRTVVLATPAESGSTVSAFGLDDRDELWSSSVHQGRGAATVTWFGTTVVVDRFTALDISTASPPAWNGDDERSRASITGIDGTTGAETWLWPKDLSSGATPWAGSTVPFVDGPDDLVVVSAHAIDEGEETSRLVGLDAATGDEMWSVDTGAARAQGFGDLVLVSSEDDLFALDASSGEERWRTPVGGGASGPSPDRAQPWGDDIIVPTNDGIATIDLGSGVVTQTPVEDAWALDLTVTGSTLAVVRNDLGGDRELLTFSRTP